MIISSSPQSQRFYFPSSKHDGLLCLEGVLQGRLGRRTLLSLQHKGERLTLQTGVRPIGLCIIYQLFAAMSKMFSSVNWNFK